MKVYLNKRYSTDPIIAYVDNVVIKTETFSNGFTHDIKGVSMEQVKNIIKGLELLGHHVNKMIIRGAYVDIDTKYYHQFPDEDMDRLYRDLTIWGYGREVYIKNNRFYTKVNDYEVVLPKWMFSNYSDECLCIEYYTD